MSSNPDHALSDRKAYALLVAVWVIAVLLIDPRAELPLNDDWAYSLPVKSWVELGRIQLTFWQSMPLLPQLAWGALFCLPTGFSFTALRLSTSLLGVVGALLCYRLLRDRGASPWQSLIAALCLLAHPMYLTLSHTFMTDVPFVTLLLASTLFYLRALDDDDALGNLVIATSLAVIATLIRQVGVMLPLAFSVALFAQRGVSRHTLPRMLVPLLIVGLSLPLSRWWIATNYGLPARYDARDSGLTGALLDLARMNLGVLRNPIERSVLLLLHLGLALLPLSWVLMQRVPRRQRAITAAVGVVCAAVLLGLGVRFPDPTGGNIMLDLAVGPRSVTLAPQVLSAAPRVVMTVLGAIGAAALLVLLGSSLQQRYRQWRAGDPPAHSILLVALCVVGFAPFSLAYGPHFDRYGLFMFPLLPALLIDRAAPQRLSLRQLSPALLAVAAFGVFSVMAVHDYLDWNRVAWSLAREQAQVATPPSVDAAFEFNNYHQQHAHLFGDAPRYDDLIERPNAPYAVMFAAPPGATVIKRAPTQALLPYAPREVVLIAR